MFKNKKVTGIILVAGNSTRFGKNRNKNFELVHNKTILSYSLVTFDKNSYIDEIMIAIKESEIKLVQNVIDNLELNKDIHIVIGGSSRQESVYNCILETDSDITIIHDGARPLIKDRFISECIENMEEYKGVAVGVKSKDTIKITDDEGIVLSTTNRENTWVVQTPQCFERKRLLEAHQKNINDASITDDCMLMEKEKYLVKLIEGDYSNIKVTTAEDIDLVTKFLDI